MKVLFISILLFLSTFNLGNSQGLNAELSFNNTIAQYAHSMANVGEYSYFTMSQVQPGNNGAQYLLVKTDTLGNIVWNVVLDFPLSNLNDPVTLIPTSDSGILVYGDAFFCDVAINCIDYIQKFDADGNLIWSKEWLDAYCNRISISGLTADSSFIYANYLQGDTSAVLQFDLAGNLLDSLPIDPDNLIQVQNFGIFEKIGITSIRLFGFDTLGNSTFIRNFSGPLQSFEVLNDTLYLLTTDSIFIFDSTLQLLNSNQFAGFSRFSNLKVSGNEIRFLSSGITEENLLVLDHELQMLDVIVFQDSIPINTPKDFSESHFTATVNFELFEFFCIRHLDFSLSSNQNADVNRTDIGIIDIQSTQVSCSPHWQNNVYYFDISADVMIKNFGSQTLNECRINHFVTYGICEIVSYFEQFTNLNLAPGDSMWLSCGEIHSNIDFLSGADTLRRTICVYTSQPNFTTDLNVSNDAYCESIIVGYVGITEKEKTEISIYPNPASSILHVETDLSSDYIIYDLSGQSVLNGNLIDKGINIESLASGFYFLRLNSTDGFKFLDGTFVKE